MRYRTSYTTNAGVAVEIRFDNRKAAVDRFLSLEKSERSGRRQSESVVATVTDGYREYVAIFSMLLYVRD